MVKVKAAGVDCFLAKMADATVKLEDRHAVHRFDDHGIHFACPPLCPYPATSSISLVSLLVAAVNLAVLLSFAEATLALEVLLSLLVATPRHVALVRPAVTTLALAIRYAAPRPLSTPSAPVGMVWSPAAAVGLHGPAALGTYRHPPR